MESMPDNDGIVESHPWLADLDPITVEVAHAGYEKARVLGHPDQARPWYVALDRLIGSQLLTRPDSDRLADSRSRAARAEANEMRRNQDRLADSYLRREADNERVLARVRGLVNHQRKTLRMADLIAALDD